MFTLNPDTQICLSKNTSPKNKFRVYLASDAFFRKYVFIKKFE